MNPFQLEQWTVVPLRNELISATDTRTLEPKTMELLVRLAATPGAVVTKEQLLADVWKGAHVVEHVLPKTMSALRKALGDDSQSARFIQTVPRRGYVLLVTPQPVAEAREEAEGVAPVVPFHPAPRWPRLLRYVLVPPAVIIFILTFAFFVASRGNAPLATGTALADSRPACACVVHDCKTTP